MPDARVVWMVELDRSPDDVEGMLSLGQQAIRFAPTEGAGAREIALTDIHRVRRIWGSPVLIVHSFEAGARHDTAFYFTKPPPLHPPSSDGVDEAPPTLIGPFNRSRPPSRRKQRRSNAGYLANAAGLAGDEVKAWTKELRAAIAAIRSR
jgi:hypothetical protein